MKTLAITLVANTELKRFETGELFNTASVRYSIPYEKNMFKMTTSKMFLKKSGLNSWEKSLPISEIPSLSLKIKYKIIRI
jgi:hypothetical protein